MNRCIRTAGLFFLIWCSGCSILPRKQPPTVTYDLGSAPATAAVAFQRSLAMQSVSAPVWLDSNAIEYRLAYQDQFRRRSYRDSRWVASPAVLIRQRFAESISQRGGAEKTEPPFLLRVELDEFVQIFDTPTSSRVIVRLRAVVQSPKVSTSTQERIFSAEVPAMTPDSTGAIRALATAVDEIVAQTLTWAGAPP